METEAWLIHAAKSGVREGGGIGPMGAFILTTHLGNLVVLELLQPLARILDARVNTPKISQGLEVFEEITGDE